MNKSKTVLLVLLTSVIAGSLLFSCQKLGKIILVETGSLTNINASGGELDAIAIDVGESGLIEHGWCIGTNPNPDINDLKINNGTKTRYGNYVNMVSGLDPETSYFARSYAIGGGQIVYGKELEFRTSTLNFIFTNSWDNKIIAKGRTYPINWSANINDKLKIEVYKDNELVKLIAEEIENSGSYDWNVSNDFVDDNNYKLIISSIENEKLRTESKTFSILDSSPPFVVSGDMSSIEYFTATAEGSIENFGTEELAVQHGHCWSKNENPTIENSKTELGEKDFTGSFTSNLTGLEENTTYYARAYASNSIGVSYGEQKMFTTLDALKPEVRTSEPTNINYLTATCGGEVISAGTHEIISRGICWSSSSNPTIADSKTVEGTGTGIFTSNITNLKDNTTYYTRAYASSDAGTSYGEEKTFTTLTWNPMDGLVAYYPFNVNANDESGNGNNGTDHGTAGYIPGHLNSARTFTNDPSVGVNATDYVEIPNVINSEEFTISFWTNFQFDGNNQMLIFLSEINDWTAANFFIDIELTNMRLAVFVNGLDLRTEDYSHQALKDGRFHEAFLNSASLEMNKYYHVTCTFANSIVILYVNGIEYAKYLNVNTVVGNPDANIKLGVCAHPTPGFLYYPLVGQLDELRFYNRALTEQQVLTLFNL